MRSHTKILSISILLTASFYAALVLLMSKGEPSISGVVTSLIIGFPFLIIFFAIPYTIGSLLFDKNEPVSNTSSKPNKLLIFSETKYWNISYWACWLITSVALAITTITASGSVKLNKYFFAYVAVSTLITLIAHETNSHKLINHLEKRYPTYFKDIFYIPIVNSIMPWYSVTGMRTVFRFVKLIITKEGFGDSILIKYKNNYLSSFALTQFFHLSIMFYIIA